MEGGFATVDIAVRDGVVAMHLIPTSPLALETSVDVVPQVAGQPYVECYDRDNWVSLWYQYNCAAGRRFNVSVTANPTLMEYRRTSV